MQLCNFVLYSSSLSSPLTLLCCLISLWIYTESQTITRLPHPKPHNTSALVPIPPMCQILFGGGHLGNIPKTSLNLLLSLWPSDRGWKYHVQAPLSASHCKLCHMQMAASGAIYPQLLSGVGSAAHYPRLVASSERLQQVAAVSWWAAVAGWMFDRCRGCSPSELANGGYRREAFVWDVAVNVQCLGLLAVPRPAYWVFHLHHYSTHSPSPFRFVFSCVQVVHGEDREMEEEQEMKRLKKPEGV